MKSHSGHIVLCSTVVWTIMLVPSGAEATQRQTKHIPTAAKHRARPSVSPSPSVRTAAQLPRRAVAAGAAEAVLVTAGMSTANGVTNTTPGGGLMARQTAPKSQSTITRDFIAKQASTASPIALAASLPGVIAASTDPLGQSTNNMSMRGMSETEIGFVYEGMPTAQPISYTPNLQEAVDNENIGSITVMQGSPDIANPVYNAVGGMMQVSLRHAKETAGGNTNFSFGSKSLKHEFLRLDSGELGHSGIKSFASFSSTANNQWRGSGFFQRYHVDSEIRKDWTPDTSLSLIFNYDDWNQNSYRPAYMSDWKKYGIKYNYPKEYTPGNSSWLKLQRLHMKNIGIMLPFKTKLSDELDFKFTPYYMKHVAYQFGGQNIANSGSFHGNQPAGDLDLPGRFLNGQYATVESISPTNYQQLYLDAGLTWHHAFNTLRFGYSYNYVDQRVWMYFAGLNYDGSTNGSYQHNPVRLPDGSRYEEIDQHFQQQMNSLYLTDEMRFFHDRLIIGAGIKYLMVSRDQVNNTPGANRYGTGTYSQPLPQVSISYKLTPHDQIYVNGTTAFRAPASVQAYGQFFQPQAPFPLTSATRLNGEYSIEEELGFRHYGLVNFSVAVFNYNITNNQVYTSTQLGSLFLPRVLQYGGKTSRGVQAEFGLRPWHHFSPYVSAQYLHATMDTNYAAINSAGQHVYLPTAGKIAVQSPKVTAAVGLAYDDGRIFGNFNFNYVSSQYSTFMNDEKIPSYETANITLGYRFNSVWYLKHPQFQLNVNNVGAKNYLSGISSVTPNAHTVRGVTGSAPQYLIAGGVGVVASLSTAF